MQVRIGNQLKDITVKYTRRQSMLLKVKEDGSIQVTCGSFYTKDDILRFIKEKEKWLIKVTHKIENRSKYLQDGTNLKEACWLGKIYPVEYVISKQKFMMILEDKIVFYLPEIKAETIREIFYEAANSQLKMMIEERRGNWDKYICQNNDRPFPQISLKYMTSRWGSYSPNTHHISMSSRLIHYPVVCLEYVLLHEYAHILEGNHSRRFYKIIETYMPEYKEYNRLLK